MKEEEEVRVATKESRGEDTQNVHGSSQYVGTICQQWASPRLKDGVKD